MRICVADKYKIVCGVCGHKYVTVPLSCGVCGSDAEFEEITEETEAIV